jgi:hypothetical protein
MLLFPLQHGVPDLLLFAFPLFMLVPRTCCVRLLPER